MNILKKIKRSWYNKRIKPNDAARNNEQKGFVCSMFLLYKRLKGRANETFRSFQKLNHRLYFFLIYFETKVLLFMHQNIQKFFMRYVFQTWI